MGPVEMISLADRWMRTPLAQTSAVGVSWGKLIILFAAVFIAAILIALLVLLPRLVVRLVSGTSVTQARRDAQNSPQGAFPVLPVEQPPGTFRVAGVMRNNEQETELLIEAKNRDNAIAKAEIRGMVVTAAEKVE